MSLFSRFKKKEELKERPEETFSRLINFMKNNKVWHGMQISQNSETGEIGLFVFTSQEEMRLNQEWYAQPRVLSQSTFQEIADFLRTNREIDSIVINPFHKSCNVKRAYFIDTMRLPNFFDFPRNNEGIIQVYEWLKENPVLLLSDDNGVIITHLFCIAHTDDSSIAHELTGNEKYVLTDFEGLKKVFLEHQELSELQLNPNSDQISLNRIAFVKHGSN
ncbi:SseB family protein [Lactococcus cremoris]|uniref:Uncharacterized protein n=1 Tax=Lactococcus cremoris subsp. tructae TaxID=542833 RepID=A0A2A5SPJ7_LACLC|nr:SseB family protein [Lactococcus cremoris]PCS15874.1 hypothetical protein RU92_GL001202 [Lactococcus cremoris subsp. tructae]